MNVERNIVLIGFMGVGKGRIARELARTSSMFAVDCDDLIESYANLKIKKIFSKFGEPYFRDLEKKIALWLEQNVSGTIISTGGGFIKVPNLKKIGNIVYLHSDFDSIIEGIMNHPNSEKKIKKRPLLKDLDAARDLFETRLPMYRSLADLEIDMREYNEAEGARKILQQLS